MKQLIKIEYLNGIVKFHKLQIFSHDKFSLLNVKLFLLMNKIV